MNYEQWLEQYEEELLISFAESGADREIEYNPEDLLYEAYEQYLQKLNQIK